MFCLRTDYLCILYVLFAPNFNACRGSDEEMLLFRAPSSVTFGRRLWRRRRRRRGHDNNATFRAIHRRSNERGRKKRKRELDSVWPQRRIEEEEEEERYPDDTVATKRGRKGRDPPNILHLRNVGTE